MPLDLIIGNFLANLFWLLFSDATIKHDVRVLEP